jgi:hypothetical protein
MKVFLLFFLFFLTAASNLIGAPDDPREAIMLYFGREVATGGPFEIDRKSELDLLSESDRTAALELMKKGAVGFHVFYSDPLISNRVALVKRNKVVGSFAVGRIKAKPLEVFLPGDKTKAQLLFPSSGDYLFTLCSKKEVYPPRTWFAGGIDSIPSELRVAHAHYSVMVALIVDDVGKVIDVAVVKSPNEALSKAVKQSAFSWIFRPAWLKAHRIPFLIYAPVEIDIDTWSEMKRSIRGLTSR